ncbi:MAG: A/G-specific adenine glycosylase [Nitrospinota bacterium]|nr:A/G-specific adenine glycosylase [Nitrospinota bacterium]
MPAENNDRKKISASLLRWFRKNQRDLPWRKTKDPYLIWVSEIMLQQTQVKTVIPYFQRWAKSFPSVNALARASEAQVLKLWEGMGYYSRARNLQKAAKIVNEEYGGKVPNTFESISKLPGIGRYTTGAILSIAYDQAVPVLDGNVKRVLARLFCLRENGASSASQGRLLKTAETLLPKKNAGDFNQALMELGATVCTNKNPSCHLCPVKNLCRAQIENRQQAFPPKKAAIPAKKIEVSAAVIRRGGKVFIQQRPHNRLMGGLWEFPGGKRKKNETPDDCLRREIREELGVDIHVGKKMLALKHNYTQFRVTLHVYQCSLPVGRIQANCCEQWKWVRPEELSSYPFPAANAKIVRYLID